MPDFRNEIGKKSISRRDFLKKSATSVAAIALSATAPGILTSCNLSFDTIIKGGTIYDGTLSDPIVADIGIRGGKIAEIGNLTGNAIISIDAAGLIVTPGFIDVHTHCDRSVLEAQAMAWNLPFLFQYAKNKPWVKEFVDTLPFLLPSFRCNHNYQYQGVTTVVTGNCGYGYANPEEWFDVVVAKRFLGTNIAHLSPHGMTRNFLFGEKQPEKLSVDQLDRLKATIAESMEMGAIGISTGLEYAPGFLAETDEIIEICKVVRNYGGLYATHMRSENGKTLPNGQIGVLAALKEAIEIGRQAEIPVEISHLKIAAPFTVESQQIIDIIENARHEGLDITADQYVYSAGASDLTYLLPNEMVDANGVKEAFKTVNGKIEIRQAISDVFEHVPPDKIYVSYFKEYPSFEGKNLVEITDSDSNYYDPADTFTDIICFDDVPFGFFFIQDMDIIRDLMQTDFIITASDGWTVAKGITSPHPRVYGTFPKKIKQFVFEENIIDLKKAINSMTSLPAEKFNLKNRGRIEKEFCADIAIIDLNKLTDKATYLNPHEYSEGVEYLIVNGVLSIDKGLTTGAIGGKIVTG